MPYEAVYQELMATPDGTPETDADASPAAGRTDAAAPTPHVDSAHAHSVSCVDCHDPESMVIRVSRPAFKRGIAALAASDVPVPHLPSIERWRRGDRSVDYDPNRMASRQEMRTFNCAQCHVEYYCGPKETVFFPWSEGLKADQIEQAYDEHRFPEGGDFYDYVHAETGGRIYKAQHPEFELWSQGIHARSGVSCTDCHNPTARPESTTTYTVEVTDSLGCIYSQDITVWVEELPPAVLPEQVAFCPGQAFALCLPPGNSYLWFSPIGSITSGECLNLPNPSSAFAGNYTVLVELPNGCRFQERFRLTAASGEDCSSMALAPSPTAANVRLFPNPTTETLHIRSRHHIENVSLFNLQGQAVLEKQVGATDIDLEVSTLPSGMYVVRIKTVEGLYIRRAVRE